MPYTKKFLKSRAACKVRFTVPAEAVDTEETVYIVGDFNDWDQTAHPMKCLKNGCHSLEMDLPAGQDFQFRYLTDTGRWFNDDCADAYVYCTFAGNDNSLIKV